MAERTMSERRKTILTKLMNFKNPNHYSPPTSPSPPNSPTSSSAVNTATEDRIYGAIAFNQEALEREIAFKVHIPTYYSAVSLCIILTLLRSAVTSTPGVLPMAFIQETITKRYWCK